MVEALLWGIALGVILGVLYDLLRFVRLLFNSRFFIDFLFWIIAALMLFSYMIIFNSGEIRSQYLLAVSAGFVIYIITMGHFTIIPEKLIVKKYKCRIKKVKIRLKKYKKVLQLPNTIYYNIKVLKRNPFKKGFWSDENAGSNEE